MLLSIGELSDRTGRTTALRYYDELGLAAGGSGGGTTAFCRVGSQGLILFIREIGFSLAEIAHFIFGERQSQRDMIDHKLAELAEQQHRIEVARIALEHGRQCPAGEPMKCSRFWSIIEPAARRFIARSRASLPMIRPSRMRIADRPQPMRSGRWSRLTERRLTLTRLPGAPCRRQRGKIRPNPNQEGNRDDEAH